MFWQLASLSIIVATFLRPSLPSDRPRNMCHPEGAFLLIAEKSLTIVWTKKGRRRSWPFPKDVVVVERTNVFVRKSRRKIFFRHMPTMCVYKQNNNLHADHNSFICRICFSLLEYMCWGKKAPFQKPYAWHQLFKERKVKQEGSSVKDSWQRILTLLGSLWIYAKCSVSPCSLSA